MINKTIFALFLTMALMICQAQGDLNKPNVSPLEVGKSMPEFSLNNVTHYKAAKASLTDFRGKWLFIDFWFPGCITCIKSFPKVNKLQEQFRDHVQFLLIGLNNQKYGGTENLFESLRKRQNLDLVVAYDSLLHARWDIWAMPYIIVIDPEGLVRFITDGRNMTADKISDLINGKEVFFYPTIDRKEFEPISDLNTSEEQSQHILYSSTLSKWRGERFILGDINMLVKLPSESQKKGFKSIGAPLAELYKQAYVGQGSWNLLTSNSSKWIINEIGNKDWWDTESPSLYQQFYPKLILELRDSSLFKYDINTDSGFYNYHLQVPVSRVKKDYLMKVMQDDLKNVFGYTAAIESRKMSVWNLVKYKGGKLIESKGGEKFRTPENIAAGFRVQNFPVEEFLGYISTYIKDNQAPFFDKTGIKYPIDAIMDADMTNFEEVRTALRKNGLNLVKGEREMKVLVIRDGPTVLHP